MNAAWEPDPEFHSTLGCNFVRERDHQPSGDQREAVRVRRSAIPSFTPLLAVGIGAVIGGFFLLAFRYHDLVRDIGLREDALGWAGLVEFTAEVAIAAGLLLFCLDRHLAVSSKNSRESRARN